MDIATTIKTGRILRAVLSLFAALMWLPAFAAFWESNYDALFSFIGVIVALAAIDASFTARVNEKRIEELERLLKGGAIISDRQASVPDEAVRGCALDALEAGSAPWCAYQFVLGILIFSILVLASTMALRMFS